MHVIADRGTGEHPSECQPCTPTFFLTRVLEVALDCFGFAPFARWRCWLALACARRRTLSSSQLTLDDGSARCLASARSPAIASISSSYVSSTAARMSLDMLVLYRTASSLNSLCKSSGIESRILGT